MKFDPGAYHVRFDLGTDWADAPELAHIQERIRLHAVPIDVLIEDPANARVHSEENVQGIRGSYAAFGQRVLIVVNARTMIVEKGNGSLSALRLGGFEYAAVLFVSDDPTTATGFGIADNRTAEQASWDLPALFEQLSTLREIEYFVPGIDDSFFEELQSLADTGFAVETDDEPDPDAPEPPASVPGVEYALGTCVVRCGEDPTHCDAIRKLWGAYAKKTKTAPGDGAL